MIPIYRAKRLYSDEYVFGVPRQDSKAMYEMIIDVVEDDMPGVIQRYIEVNTLSIHFPDMLDSQGNKIFASLQKDGRGGDVCSVNDYIDSGLGGVAIYQNYGFRIDRKGKAMGISLSSTDIKIIGIQQ